MADDFQTALRDAVQATGLSQRAFAAQMGVPLRTLEDWLAGKRMPPQVHRAAALETAAKLAEGETTAQRDAKEHAEIIN